MSQFIQRVIGDVIFGATVLFLAILISGIDAQYRIEMMRDTITKEVVDSVLSEHHNNILLTYSLRTMRQEVDSLSECVYNANKLWLTVYDFVSPAPRYDWIEGLTTSEIDSVMSLPEYEEWTTEKCREELQRQGVIP